MLKRSRSLRRKLIAMVLVTTLAALLVALLAIIAYDLRVYHQDWTIDVTTQAELLGQTTAPALAFDDPDTARENLELMRLRPQVQAAAIFTARGALFASYRRDEAQAEVPQLPAADGTRIDGASLELYRRILGDDEILGTVYLRTDYELYRRVLDYLFIALAVIVLAMLVAFLMSAQLQRIITGPVLMIASVARDVVQRGDYSARAHKLSNDEVGELADAFNGMLGEIEARTGELELANTELERQNAERTRAEQEVLRLNAELEDRVRDRTAQLEAVNQELEAFSYSVSHDLRAPLRAIGGFSQALTEDFPEHVPEEARRYLSRIHAGTERMSELIDGLLNLSRVSRVPLVRNDVDVNAVVAAVIEDLRQHDPHRNVAVSIWDGMRAAADPHLLRALYENLLGNAWKFTARTAEPRIEAGMLRDGARAVFFVRDNGAGFDMAFADKLFKAFQRLHGGNEYAGTGIGLATVQRIVRRHGGRAWADGTVGKGAAFYFTLESDGGANGRATPEPASAGTARPEDAATQARGGH